MLNDWYAMMGQLIQEFETKYEQTETTPPVEDSTSRIHRMESECVRPRILISSRTWNRYSRSYRERPQN